MDDNTIEILATLALTVTLLVLALLSRRRRQPFVLRGIPAYDAMPGVIGRSIEADRPAHLSFGSAGLGGETTALAVASAELAYHLARRGAIGDTSPLLTLSSASALPLAQDSLRRAYQSRGSAARYNPLATRWFPEGPRSLGFAAGVSAMLGVEGVSGSVLSGSHGAEVALILLSGSRMNQPSIVGSDQLEGQAVAFAMSDHALLGDELFVAGPYLDETTDQSALPVMIDVLRWALIAAMFLGWLLTLGG